VNKCTTFEIFSELVYDLYACSMVRMFGFQLRFDDKRQRPPMRYQVQVLTRSACMHLETTQTRRDERSILSIGRTREELIEKHFDDTMQAKNKRDVRPGSSIYRANTKFEAAMEGTNVGDTAQESVDNESQYGG